MSVPPVSQHAPHRLTAFLDAIVAIAVTVLVLPLADAAVDADPAHLSLPRFLREHTSTMWSFALSFVVILGLWRSHHDLFERLDAYDGRLRSWTFVWVFTVVVTPFTTQLIATYGPDPVAECLYIGTLFLSSLAQTVMARWMERHRDLVRPAVRDEPVPVAATTATTALFAVALLLALLVPGLGYSGLWVLLLTRPVVLAARAVRGRRPR